MNNIAVLEARLSELKANIKDKDDVLARLKKQTKAAEPSTSGPNQAKFENNESINPTSTATVPAKVSRLQFRSKRSGATAGQAVIGGAAEKKPASRAIDFEMPRDIAENEALDDAIRRTMPTNYNFEIKKTLWRIRRCNAKKVAIQFPEGLLIFACPISDLLERFGGVEVFIFADVTYGACCVDDFAARALDCELLVHYGHSCLVPVDITSSSPSKEEPGKTQVMYVFVDVNFDVDHMVESIKLEFPNPNSRLALLGTIQFSGSLHAAKTLLDKYYQQTPALVPQAKPLSSGEVLGCTSPSLPQDNLDAFIFVADGRFHLESAMIANPSLPALRYDPYGKSFTKEAYDSPLLLKTRLGDINRARHARRWGIVLGTLGRQGNPAILQRITKAIQEVKADAHIITVLLSELSPSKLAAMENEVEAWVQIACPRLSIDWGEAFSKKPLLTPYECFVALGKTEWRTTTYPQDFYSKGSGPWTNYYESATSVN